MEVVSCHSAGAKNFEVAARFFEYLCTSVNHYFSTGVPHTVYFIMCLKCFLWNIVFICNT